MKNLLEMNWTDLVGIDKDKSAIFIGLAPIEEHGKHLPLGVDIYETQYWMEQAIKELEEEYKEFTFITLPVISYGHAEMKGFPGNIHLSQKLLYDLVLATVENVLEWGIKNIIVISGHADLKHIIAIEQVCEKIKKDTGAVVFAPMGAIFSKNHCFEMEKEDTQVKAKMALFSNDFHAGWVETSNMLVIRPKLVKANYIEQPDIEMTGKDMMDSKVVMEKIKGYGHIGFPKEATKELGVALNKEVVQKIRYCVSAYLKRKEYEHYEHHHLYHVPVLRVREEE